MTEIEFAALLVSRVCHDLVGPLGAVINGLEVLEDERDADMREEAIKLVTSSAGQALARIQFMRIAFGAAGSAGAELDLSEVGRLLAGLLEGSKIAAKLEDVSKLQDRTTDMIQNYGAVRGYDLVNVEFVGKSLCRMTYLTRSDVAPVRWRIVFYRPADRWRVFNLQIDDAVMEFFGK